jgi:hypothetical protein
LALSLLPPLIVNGLAAVQGACHCQGRSPSSIPSAPCAYRAQGSGADTATASVC